MIDKIIQKSLEKNASDIHLITKYRPFFRINGKLLKMDEVPNTLSAKDVENIIASLINHRQLEVYKENKELDFAYSYQNSRFRINIYTAQDNPAVSIRIIPKKIKTLKELLLPESLNEVSTYNYGLVLVTGQTGQGKSTTLASLINEINLYQAKHIVTIEDPIEYVYEKGASIISQRELITDTLSWRNALRSVLREDPDVILVGEMRDFETIQAVLTLAETGHLVFSTLHTSSTSETINRIVDIFPPHKQNQIKTQLASVLKLIISQKLIPKQDDIVRIPAVEVLKNTPAVASLIREGKTHMIQNILQTSENAGMIIFEKYLLKLYREGMIAESTALEYAFRPSLMKKII